ncbi:MAG: hypothetical protein RDV48_09075 [Candidatus Eremiobacteraeota bacterium]|nr:hypothetical protein [Candidatus Eremiobacteraeota bacterium]
MKLKDLLSLFPIAAENLIHGAFLKLRELAVLGTSPWWWNLQFLLFLHYFFDPPYRIITRQGSDEGNLIYGETPLLTLRSILARIRPGKDDVFMDLGCGRGLPLAAAHYFADIPAIGIDCVGEFIRRGRKIFDALGIKEVSLQEGSFLNCDLSKGTIFFLAGTTFASDTLASLVEKLKQLEGKRTVISLSQELPGFRTLHRGYYDFSWGKGSAYIQEREERGPEEGASQGPGERRESPSGF